MGARRRALFFAVCALAALVPACHETTTEVVYVTGLILTPADTAIRQGGSLQLRASLVDTAGHPVLDVPAAFASSDSSVARVSASGFLTTRGPLGGVIVTASYSRFEAAAFVRVFDSTLSASLELSARPFGVAASAQNVVYVTRLDAAALARIDLPRAAFSGSVPVGSVPTSVDFNPGGTTAYVANQFSGNVGVVNVATNTQAGALPVTGDPSVARVSPDGTLLWISTNADSLYGVDLASNSTAHRFGFPWLANGLAFHPTNDSLLYASVLDGTVREINFKRDTVLRTFTLGGRLQGIAVAPNAAELYVANENTWQLQVVSLSSGSVVDSVSLGGAPFDLQLSPDKTKIWISVMTTGQVKVFDRVTRALSRTIATQGTPRRIAFAASGTTVVANESGWVDLVK